MENYQVVPLDTFNPTEMSDRRQLRVRLENILPFPVSLFSTVLGTMLEMPYFYGKYHMQVKGVLKRN